MSASFDCGTAGDKARLLTKVINGGWTDMKVLQSECFTRRLKKGEVDPASNFVTLSRLPR
jgi:hypothetical protein